jgi:hypothetical protein
VVDIASAAVDPYDPNIARGPLQGSYHTGNPMRLIVNTIATVVLISWSAIGCWADEATQNAAAQNIAASDDAIDLLISDLTRRALPEKYEDRSNWGGQKEILTGLQVKREGLRIRTNRRKKKVNHGTWRRYQIEPADAAALQVKVRNLRLDGEGQFTLDVTTDARLHAVAQLTQWNRGLRLASVSCEADARVWLKLEMLVAVKFEREEGLPTVVIRPKVTKAELKLRDFRLRRVGEFKGALVKELGRQLRNVIDRRVAAEQGRLAARINQQIEANQDDLRLSLSEFAKSGWADAKGLETEREEGEAD